MTDFVDCNHLAWRQHLNAFDTFSVNQPFDIHLNRDIPFTGSSAVEPLTQMDMPGKVVAILVEVLTNDHPDIHTLTFKKGTGSYNSPTIVDVAPVTIPAMTTGFFATNHLLAEFNREFNSGNYIGGELRKTGGGITGIHLGAIMLGLEIETPGS